MTMKFLPVCVLSVLLTAGCVSAQWTNTFTNSSTIITTHGGTFTGNVRMGSVGGISTESRSLSFTNVPGYAKAIFLNSGELSIRDSRGGMAGTYDIVSGELNRTNVLLSKLHVHALGEATPEIIVSSSEITTKAPVNLKDTSITLGTALLTGGNEQEFMRHVAENGEIYISSTGDSYGIGHVDSASVDRGIFLYPVFRSGTERYVKVTTNLVVEGTGGVAVDNGPVSVGGNLTVTNGYFDVDGIRISRIDEIEARIQVPNSDQFLRIQADRDVLLTSGDQIEMYATTSFNVFSPSYFSTNVTVHSAIATFPNLPTATNGLPQWALWRDGETVKIKLD